MDEEEHAPLDDRVEERAPDGVEDEQDAGEELRQGFAELQRLFPGRVIEVIAPPRDAGGVFEDAPADSGDDAPGADDDLPDDADDEAQPSISFVPERSDE